MTQEILRYWNQIPVRLRLGSKSTQISDCKTEETRRGRRRWKQTLHWLVLPIFPKKEKKRRKKLWRMICDMWHVTCHTWHVTPDLWHLLGDEHSLQISALQLWIYFHKPSLTLMNYEAVCRTAPATPSLLKIFYI